jgi:hypothetical protein
MVWETAIVFFTKIVFVKILLRGTFISSLVYELCQDVCKCKYVLHCHITLIFNRTMYTYVSQNFIKWLFISVFIKELCVRVCRHEYRYHVDTLPLALIMFSRKMMYWLKLYQEVVLSHDSSRNCMVESVGKQLCGGVHRCEHLYHVATSHSNLITFSAKVVNFSWFY